MERPEVIGDLGGRAFNIKRASNNSNSLFMGPRASKPVKYMAALLPLNMYGGWVGGSTGLPFSFLGGLGPIPQRERSEVGVHGSHAELRFPRLRTCLRYPGCPPRCRHLFGELASPHRSARPRT